jgi:hypothetical protein
MLKNVDTEVIEPSEQSEENESICDKCGSRLESRLVSVAVKFPDGKWGDGLKDEILCPKCDWPKRRAQIVLVYLLVIGIIITSGYIVYLIFR